MRVLAIFSIVKPDMRRKERNSGYQSSKENSEGKRKGKIINENI
jgi:hypothetical protein